MENVHLSLRSPINEVLVQSEFIGFPKGSLYHCKILGFSSYPNEVLTAIILVEDSMLFYYIPLMALYLNNGLPLVEDMFALVTFNCYENCPSSCFVFHELISLKSKVVAIFTGNKDFVGYGKYISSLDWPNENVCMHLIEYKNMFYLWPHHKLLFLESEPENQPSLLNPMKLRATYRI